MISRIENGDANGILAWHPDRLARNSVDGGKIIYLLDGGGLADLKFPQFWCENTSQGKFMLNIAFGQSKYYVDSLAENTKRGLRQKVRRGEYPGLAPVGYINDVRTKTVVVDKKRASFIRKAFEMYAKNGSRLEDIANFFGAIRYLFSERQATPPRQNYFYPFQSVLLRPFSLCWRNPRRQAPASRLKENF